MKYPTEKQKDYLTMLLMELVDMINRNNENYIKFFEAGNYKTKLKLIDVDSCNIDFSWLESNNDNQIICDFIEEVKFLIKFHKEQLRVYKIKGGFYKYPKSFLEEIRNKMNLIKKVLVYKY